MYQQRYQQKRISVEDAVGLVQSNQHIVLGGGPIEPWEFIANLPKVSDRLKNVKISALLSMKAHEIMVNPKYKGIFELDSGFYSGVHRASNKLGLCSHMPTHLRNCADGVLRRGTPDIYVVTVSAMDQHGYVTTGPGAIYEPEMIHSAKTVIFEVNSRSPRTFGDTVFHISDADYVYEVDRPVPVLPSAPISDEDRIIGSYIAELIEDGSTIQLGIGGIPNAAAQALMEKKDLGIHTEMLNDAMVDLVRAGVVTGRCKTLYPDKIITSFCMGSQKVYDFIDNNPGILHFKAQYTNAPDLVKQNYKMVSVNTTIMVDFSGQCASESVRSEQISGTGGQVETSIGAQMAMHGKSIIALHATAEIKMPDTGERKRVSNIVPFLEPGTIVTLTRTDVDYVVTEYGVAHLKGLTVKERTKALIAIAHPDFRAELEAAAQKYHFI
ncbi:4-hydroxybutyrate--acetyl-CoA CoA transferase [Fusibacter paucivorans]|uniref:4-hydroxybutyrate--acetyl-CoA CoA transferase n=1 Tax=Fusibacter paucivorans TaxID=76009 RepID=A0ABS5PSG6_9FIRM|nr:acetyl-CoA hydrolase/transferase C-terminal domain-containing protein [Fusibacter paucivorans]MBS7527812.1 4-hydroxybutyrate--acetyl-CoA CoA transferase [Fusibacter paucivorans]